MTVRELIEVLSTMDPDRLVVLQKDAEGNGYSPLSGADDNATYEAGSTWSGRVGPETLTEELVARGFTDEDKVGGVPCVVLFPVN